MTMLILERNHYNKESKTKLVIDSNSNLGLRARNKQEKLKRIQEAAQKLFKQKGFEATTTREIAELAQVGTGTLFLYVKDKQELLQLVFYDAIVETMAQAFDNLPPNLTLLDELVHIFAYFFRLYNQDIVTSRFYIKELIFQQEAMQQNKAAAQIEHFLKLVGVRLEQAKVRGEIDSSVNIEQATRNFFALYYFTLTGWLSGMFELEIAINQVLRNAFALQIIGLIPNPVKNEG